MAVRLTRPERKARTRAEILEAARAVFLREGFHGASLEEIAQEAGYTKGAVYSSFESKGDLFLALLDERFEWRIAESLQAARVAPTLEAAMRANARMIMLTAQREPTWDPLLIEFWTHASRDSELRAAALARHDRVLDAIAEMLVELAERFDVEWTLAAREVARAGGAFGRGMSLERLLDPTAAPVATFEEQFLTLLGTFLRPTSSNGGSP